LADCPDRPPPPGGQDRDLVRGTNQGLAVTMLGHQRFLGGASPFFVLLFKFSLF
jgi:hypothetical protein